MRAILLCGYRRTGKDAFFQRISTGNSPYSWIIYRRPDSKMELPLTSTVDPKLFVRVAFADALKTEVSEKFNIPAVISDSEKDEKKFVHPFSKIKVSARDLYMEWANIRRNQDVDYWCKAAFPTISEQDHLWWVITDWRYHNEGNYVKKLFSDTITVRLFRKDVAIPPVDLHSEHTLDQVATDFLVVANEQDFQTAIEVFPQYQHYVKEQTLA